MCECCPNNLTFDYVALKCICPPSKPIYHAKKNKCTACPAGL